MKFLILLTVLAVFLALPINSFAEGKSFEHKDWSVLSLDWGVKYSSNGRMVHGHEFGFVKRPSSCGQDLFWISWSATSNDVREVVKNGATVRLDVDGTIINLEMPTGYTYNLTERLTIFSLSGLVATDKLVSLLLNGSKVHVSIGGPVALLNELDIYSDTFSLEGFTAANLKAKEYCENISLIKGPKGNVSDTENTAVEGETKHPRPDDDAVSVSDKLKIADLPKNVFNFTTTLDYQLVNARFETSEGLIPPGCFGQLMTELNGDDTVAAIFLNRTSLRGCIDANDPFPGGIEDEVTYDILKNLGKDTWGLRVCQVVHGSLRQTCSNVIVKFVNRKYIYNSEMRDVLSVEKMGEWSD